MADGYFIRKGDKTTCGGEVLEGDSRMIISGAAQAREGDQVSCGKNNKTYVVVGGVSYFNSQDRLVAGSLDSFSSCPCRAGLIPSQFSAVYGSSHSAESLTRLAATAQAAPVAASTPVTSRSSSYTPAPGSHVPLRDNSAQAVEPGFYIVPKSTTREELEASLFTLRDPAVMGKFKLLNPNLRDIKAGSMIVLSDPNNFQCTREEALLMNVAAKTNEILETLSPAEADFMVEHRDAIQTILGFGSGAIGVGASIFKNNLDNVGGTLREMEALHQRSFLRDGHLNSPTFLAERQKLLAQLDSHLTSLTRKGIGFPHHPNLNRAMFLSPPSLVHRWTEAGGVGQMPGYATHLEGVARASKYLNYGGWAGTALGGGASVMKVHDVCNAGNTEVCERVKFTETGSFVGGIGGGMFAGAISAHILGGICVGLGIPTGGFSTLACAVLATGATTLSASYVGEKVGETTAEKIYEALN